MHPVIALVGRPNVGKSTLFNRLTRSRDALVADFPGLTRDRQYGDGLIGEKPYIVIDTGGLASTEKGINEYMAEQVWMAIDEADCILFLLDARDGINLSDEQIAERLRRTGKPVFLALNKTDGHNSDAILMDAYALGLGEPTAIAASHGRGVTSLMDQVLGTFPDAPPEGDQADILLEGIKVAVVGKPNVGKSTLINRILGEERVLAFDEPGTTRDSIYIPFERDGQKYTLIDTAGVRRRSRVNEMIEKFSVVKTLKAIIDSHVVVLVLDAHSEGVAEQDATLAGHIIEQGRAVVIAINKWDGLNEDQKTWYKRELERRLPFMDFAEKFFISALHGTGVGNLYDAIHQAYSAARIKISTPDLTRMVEKAVQTHQPPLVRGRRIKLRYAHQGGHNPPLIIIHGNQTNRLPHTYKRYLINYFRSRLKLTGTPLRVQFKTGDNPFEGRRNKLTPRQERKRKRMLKHLKS